MIVNANINGGAGPNLVRAARLRAGITQEHLAARSGVCLSTLRWAEKGIASERTLALVAAVLCIDVAELRGTA